MSSTYMQHVLLDHIDGFDSHLISSATGQYVGQTDDGHLLYGFGSYLDNNANQRIGLFRSGSFLFGISITTTSAIVGTTDDYVSYSLSTGNMDYVFHAGQKTLVDMRDAGDYAFVSMTYANGDRYIGETYKNKRHGYGIYYYSNGDFWWGEYNDDARSGIGCLFRTNHSLRFGIWEGEEEKRATEAKLRK